MKALSVKQPWASLIAEGLKTVEVRTWSTKYRGRLLICASRSPKAPFAGMAVAVVTLADCRYAAESDARAARCGINPGRDYAWVLTGVKKIPPYPVKGKLGLFEVGE